MNTSIYQNIATRTAGDIYIGVVGPVRTGKSTFIKRFMETLVIPNIENVYRRERARDELPQSGCPVYEVNVDGIKENHFQAVLSDELILDYENGRFQMHFTTKSKTSVSAGRSLRYAEVGTLENVKILADTSSVEVFVNDGEFVFSTRYYPNDYKIVVHSPSAHITFDKIQ